MSLYRLPRPLQSSSTDRDPDMAGEQNPRRKARLPRDAHVSVSTDPPELYISMTITRPEHVQALLDTIHTFTPMLHEYER